MRRLLDRSHDSSEDIISHLKGLEDDPRITRAFSPDEPDPSREGRRPTDEDAATIALEEYLAGRLQQIGEVPPERKEVKGLKTGNGWDANQVIEQVFKIEPIPIRRAVEIALATNRSVTQRIKHSLTGGQKEVELVGTPTVEFVPIWRVKGFHECYYIRSRSYKVNVKDDVVAVELEGRSRDLMLEKKHSRLIPSAIVDRLLRLSSFLSNESKYFVLTDALELAVKASEAELVISGAGRSLTMDDEAELTSWKSKRIFDEGELKVRGAKIQLREPSLTKEALLTKFRERVIQMPENFKQILSNKLQITELRRIYVPLIRVPLQRGLVPREVVVNGTTGALAEARLLTLFE
jgi:hypothetical protein